MATSLSPEVVQGFPVPPSGGEDLGQTRNPPGRVVRFQTEFFPLLICASGPGGNQKTELASCWWEERDPELGTDTEALPQGRSWSRGLSTWAAGVCVPRRVAVTPVLPYQGPHRNVHTPALGA